MAPWARALLLVALRPAARGWAAEPTAVRGSNPALAQAIAEAELQSRTFRRLVAGIGDLAERKGDSLCLIQAVGLSGLPEDARDSCPLTEAVGCSEGTRSVSLNP